MKKIILAVLIILITALLWTACKKQSVNGTIALYTSVPKDVVEKVIVHFENDNPGIKVEIYRDSTGNIMDKVYADIADNGKPNADVIWIADPANMEELAGKDLLLPYEPKDADKIIPGFIDYRNLYTTTRLLLMAIVYHDNNDQEVPESYIELIDEKYSDNISIINYTSGSSQYTLCALVEKHGESYVSKLAANATSIAKDNKSLIDKIAFDEASVGIADLAQIKKYMRDYPGRGINYILPKDGIIAVPSPIAISKTTQNPGASKKLIDWVISAEGQTSLSSLETVPVRADVPFPFDNMDLSDLNIMNVRIDSIDKHKDFIKVQLDSIITE